MSVILIVIIAVFFAVILAGALVTGVRRTHGSARAADIPFPPDPGGTGGPGQHHRGYSGGHGHGDSGGGHGGFGGHDAGGSFGGHH